MAAKQLRVCAGLQTAKGRPAPSCPTDTLHVTRGCCLQEVAETMEKQGLKAEAIEFYTQVRVVGEHACCAGACCRGFVK